MKKEIRQQWTNYATNKRAKTGVHWGIRIGRACLSGYFKGNAQDHIELFVAIDPSISRGAGTKS
jgi:hypothetical protein